MKTKAGKVEPVNQLVSRLPVAGNAFFAAVPDNYTCHSTPGFE